MQIHAIQIFELGYPAPLPPELGNVTEFFTVFLEKTDARNSVGYVTSNSFDVL